MALSANRLGTWPSNIFLTRYNTKNLLLNFLNPTLDIVVLFGETLEGLKKTIC